MLKKILSLLSFFKLKNTVDLDNDGLIESYRGEVEGVFSQFKRAHDKLIEVNEKLLSVADDERTIADEALKRIDKIQNDLETNVKLQEKIKDFIL